jgi:hypothetical protein
MFYTEGALRASAHEKSARGDAALEEAGFLKVVTVIMAKIMPPFREKSLLKRKVPQRAGGSPGKGMKFA